MRERGAFISPLDGLNSPFVRRPGGLLIPPGDGAVAQTAVETVSAAYASSPFFDPTALSYLAQDGANTISAAVGSPVGYEAPSIGAADPVLQSNSVKRPLLRATHLEMDGSSYLAQAASGIGYSGAITLFVQVRAAASVSSSSSAVSSGTFGSGQSWQLDADGANKVRFNCDLGSLFGLTTWPTTNSLVVVYWASGAQRLWLNGGTQITQDAIVGTPSLEAVRIGINRGVNAEWIGDIGQVLFVKGAMTAAEINSVGAEMGSGWGGFSDVTL